MGLKPRKLIENSLAIFINRFTQSITTFILIASIARILGPYNLGQYTLAFSYYFLFMTLTSQGFKTLFTRELSAHPQQTSIYLVNGTLLQLIFSIIGYVAMVLLVFALPYNVDTSNICYLLGLMIIPFSISNITEAIFQAQEKMYLITISTVPIYMVRTLVIISAMNLNYDLRFVCTTMVVSEVLILLIEWSLIIRLVSPKWQIKADFIKKILTSVRTFLAIEGMAVLKGRMLVIIISLFCNEVIVGVYGSIVQLMQPFEIIAHSLVVAVFPSMSKAVELGKDKQRDLAETIVEMLLCVALPLIMGLLFIGKDILMLVYGNPKFAEGAMALNIISLGLVVASFTRPLGYLLVANSLEWVNLVEVSSTSILTGLIGFPLISSANLLGAAITALIIPIITSCQYIYAVNTLLFYLNVKKIIYRPLLISIFMLGIFLILKLITENVIITMIVSTLAYIICVGSIVVYEFGGIQKARRIIIAKKND